MTMKKEKLFIYNRSCATIQTYTFISLLLIGNELNSGADLSR